MSNTKHQIVVIGAGTGGLTVAAALKKQNSSLDIAIIDPAETHYYQPAWTLVGANAYDFDKTGRPMKSLIPSGVKWIKNYVSEVSGANNTVTLDNGEIIEYEYFMYDMYPYVIRHYFQRSIPVRWSEVKVILLHVDLN